MLTKVLEKRLRIMIVFIIFVFIALIARLTYLQLFQSKAYQTLSEQNRIRLISVPAPRGEIVDANGTPLVKDRPVFVISVAYLDDQKTTAMIDKLGGILGMKPEDIVKVKETVKDSKLPKYEPIRVMKDVPIYLVTKIEEKREELPDVMIDVEPQRQYLKGNFMPQVLGYTREISPEELVLYESKGYKPADRFGKDGLEKQYQEYLKGIDGAHQVEVNNQGRVVRDLGLKDAIAGNNLILTIDTKYQNAAEKALDKAMASVQKEFPEAKAGSMVMIDVNTGKVLALASRPGYDPNIFNSTLSQADSDALFTKKPGQPPAAINRAFSGYPPGSTYKMLTATAALQSGAITGSTILNDPGTFTIPGVTFKCWQSWGHGQSNIIRALQVSCDVFFYKAGDMAGVNNIVKYGQEYGFGQKTGIDLPGESSGTLPSPEWKEKVRGPVQRKLYNKYEDNTRTKYDKLINDATSDRVKKQLTRDRDGIIRDYEAQYKAAIKWQRYETINMSIGQGDNQITPLQLANYVATIANGGTRYKPYLVDKITDVNGKIVKEFKPEVMQKMSVSPENMDLVRKGMAAVTQGEGTASGLFANWPIKVAAKTGTAETSSETDKVKTANNGVFVAFAPFDNPKVAVAALVEFSGHGGTAAGSAVRDLLATYFNIQQAGGVGYSPE